MSTKLALAQIPSAPFQPVKPSPVLKIKVLQLIYSVCHGGIETALINWIKNFDRDLFEIHVAYFAGDRNREQPFLQAAKAENIETIPIPWSRWKPFFKAARAVARVVRELNIDLIHTHAYYADAVGSLAQLFARVKTMSTVYVWGDYEFHRQLMQWMDHLSIKFMDKVTAHCEDTYRKTIARGFKPEDVPVLFSGFPVDRRPADPKAKLRAKEAEGVPRNESVLLNIARLAPEKAQDQLLESFRLIVDRCPDTRLWISGVGLEAVENQLLELRRKLDLEGKVFFPGYRHDIWSLLDAADIMAHPSHVEGVPLALQYGMAAALPIVVSNVGGVSEIIKHGRSGLLIAENDVNGFSETVIDLLENPEKAHSLGQGARTFLETEYSITKAVAKVEKSYREVITK